MRMYKTLLVVSLFTSLLSPVARADAPSSFSFTGSGYGHGVGMSQIGAKAKALSGESATAILNYYYKDVAVVPVVDSQTIRVNIGHQLKLVSLQTITQDSSLTIYPGDIGNSQDLQPSASYGLRQKVTIRLQGNTLVAGTVTSKVLTVRWSGPNAIISMTSLGKSIKYRYGQVQVKVANGALEVTNSLSVHDEYLWGISEMTSTWPAAALEAQVIASRSYALSKLGTLKPSCDCNVSSNISDQNFVGYAKEIEPKIGALWKAAVMRTNLDSSTSLAIISNGRPIQAYYFSSSGGATQSTQDAWGEASSYTQSVADPASLDTKLNPRFASWTASVDQALVATAFLLPDVVSLDVVSRNAAGAVTYIKGTSSNGSTKLLRGDTFRSRVKLASPYFRLTP
jgi:stage II sporulation protein D